MGTRVDVELELYRMARLSLAIADAGSDNGAWWSAAYDGAERARAKLRHAVIMEGANVPCEQVRDGGG